MTTAQPPVDGGKTPIVPVHLDEVWGSVFRFDAQVSVFWGRPPSEVAPVQLRDLFPAPPPEGQQSPGAIPPG